MSEWTEVTQKKLYGGNFEERAGSIRALIFGEMVRLAENKIDIFRSDLYHDAMWMQENLTGPMSFGWIVRNSGTHIGTLDANESVAKIFEDATDNQFKVVVVGYPNQIWAISIYQKAPKVNVPDTAPSDTVQSVQSPGVWLQDANETVPLPAGLIEHYGIDTHAILPTEECDLAHTAAGCIHHPALMDANCDREHTATGCVIKYHNKYENVTVTGDPEAFSPFNFPTPVNTQTNNKERGTMDSILRDLREKRDEATSAKEELDEQASALDDKKDEIDNAQSDLDSYIEELDNLIDSLDSLPEVSIYVDSLELDTVSFDS